MILVVSLHIALSVLFYMRIGKEIKNMNPNCHFLLRTAAKYLKSVSIHGLKVATVTRLN